MLRVERVQVTRRFRNPEATGKEAVEGQAAALSRSSLAAANADRRCAHLGKGEKDSSWPLAAVPLDPVGTAATEGATDQMRP
jgi:hypothetical protein